MVNQLKYDRQSTIFLEGGGGGVGDGCSVNNGRDATLSKMIMMLMMMRVGRGGVEWFSWVRGATLDILGGITAKYNTKKKLIQM